MSKKPLLYSALAIITAGIGYASSALNTAPVPNSSTSSDSEPVVFYGSVEQSLDWFNAQTVVLKTGPYTFTSSPEDDITPCTTTSPTSTVTDGGVYFKGKYYYITGDGVWRSYKTWFKRMNTDTWTVEEEIYKGENSTSLAYDITYDYITGTAYASCPESYGSGTCVLRTVNLETGDFTDVATMSATIKAIACDGNGQLWGISSGAPANLYKIDKQTGALSLVGSTGLNMREAQTSATFDLRTGKLYWTSYTYTENAALERSFSTDLVEVSTSTGATTVIKNFPNQEQIVGLFIKDTHPKAPEEVANLQFSRVNNSTTTGSLTFTLPTRTYDRNALTNNVSIKIYIDGNLFEEKSNLTPGSAYTSATTELSEGTTHHISVICLSAEGLESKTTLLDVYSGEDIPAKVSNIQISATPRGEQATITWDGPSIGKNGGVIDLENLTYKIIRKPDNKTIAEGLTETTYVDNLDRNMCKSQYEIYAVTNAGESEVEYSPTALLGTAYSIPYLETFDNYSRFYTYTVIDANKDGDNNGGMWFFDYTELTAFWYSKLTWADDWLISPTIDLSHDKVYRISFHTYGYMGGNNNHIVVTVGALPEIESQTQVILDQEYAAEYKAITLKKLFNPHEGACRIGFHNISNGKDHMSIDNVYIQEYGTTDIPDVATIQSAEGNSNKVTIQFTTPTTAVNGDALTELTSIKIYKNNSTTPTFTIDAPEVGGKITWEDNSPIIGTNSYTIVACNSAGDGMEAIATVDTTADVPKAVENISVKSQKLGTEAYLEWAYPSDFTGVNGESLSTNDITYNVYRTISYTTTLVAEGISETSFVDTDVDSNFGEDQQKYVSYSVEAVTTGGAGEKVSTANILLGKAFVMPFKETWPNQSTTNRPWQYTSPSNAGSWAVTSMGFDPMTNGQDGMGLASFSLGYYSSGGYADFISPRIDLTGLSNPTLSFWLYCTTDSNSANSYLQVGVNTETGGTTILDQQYRTYNDATTGWVQYTVDLAQYSTNDYISIVFRGYSYNKKGAVHIDNVVVSGTQSDYDLRMISLEGPQTCIIGRENIFTASIHNTGKNDNSDFTINFLKDGNVVMSEHIDILASGATRDIEFNYAPELSSAEGNVTLTATIVAENDANDTNNSASLEILLISPDLPYVNDLAGNTSGQVVTLSWNDPITYPHQNYVTDDFESYQRFAISNIGEWGLVDVDGSRTVGITTNTGMIQWDNATQAQAYIVFNPYSINIESIVTPYSGQQCLVCFSSVGKDNDDWLISPILSGDAQTISFYAKALYPQNPVEKFEIWASKSSNSISDFTKISGDTPISVTSGTVWNQYSYDIPAGYKYFAIRCVSSNQFGLMIDDITYAPAHNPIELWGFNVYRNGEMLNSDLIGAYSYTDNSAEAYTDYNYNVTAVFDQGESIFSNTVTLTTGVGGVNDITNDTVKVFGTSNAIAIINAYELPVAIYAIDGRTICSFYGTGNDVIPMEQGIYIVKAGSCSTKVVVK